MQEQPNVEEFVKKLLEKYSEETAIDTLSSIIKQQMLYGGVLEDKIEYYKKFLKLF